MFIAANFVSALATILNYVLEIYTWVIIIRALISWVNPDPYNPIVQFLYKITEPVLYPLRKLMRTYSTGIDLSPLVAILIIMFLRQFLVSSLFELARQLR
ncbi:YggT family protein [Candidatus Manganitrophus noduliformans]|uniref:YggT family protein n=1 Tax=Candidatus Manganitrophus noduliformans TaxID=2606439 RepID=A0A7X6DNG4_9BACT|nr:YggT family protein [Candidatus Manganitrophus noduliformans]NKE70409.1 YggT family protein [Candidatus Manganitrophus noduliformans]